MTIGIPRALLFYKYRYLWETFFKELGCEVVISGQTSNKTLSDGINYSIDEACLPSKIYMGHVYELMGKCDYILTPRIDNFGVGKMVCVKFNAMYDIVRNTFPNARVIGYNVDVIRGAGELRGFINMGKQLGNNSIRSFSAYQKAKSRQAAADVRRASEQAEIVDKTDGYKILIVTHPYNIYDRLVGYPIVRFIKQMGGNPLYADACSQRESVKSSFSLSKDLYWIYNRELVGAINLLKDKVDGIILLTAFPCGQDSLVNEILLRRLKSLPVINIVLDELQGDAGLFTRIESFMDIIKMKKDNAFLSEHA